MAWQEYTDGDSEDLPEEEVRDLLLPPSYPSPTTARTSSSSSSSQAAATAAAAGAGSSTVIVTPPTPAVRGPGTEAAGERGRVSAVKGVAGSHSSRRGSAAGGREKGASSGRKKKRASSSSSSSGGGGSSENAAVANGVAADEGGGGDCVVVPASAVSHRRAGRVEDDRGMVRQGATVVYLLCASCGNLVLFAAAVWQVERHRRMKPSFVVEVIFRGAFFLFSCGQWG